MLAKIAAFAWKELYVVYTDRNQLLVMIATPLALASIIGFAFSSFFTTGNDLPIQDIPVAVVNLDEGALVGATELNNGQIFIDLLVSAAGSETDDDDDVLRRLTDAVELDSPESARAAVDTGDYAAAIIIPPDFSRRLTYTSGAAEGSPALVEVYGSPATPVSAEVVRTIADNITNQIITGSITIASTIETLVRYAQSRQVLSIQFLVSVALGGFNPDFEPAFEAGASPVRIEQQTVTGEATSFNPLVYFGASNAIFFMLFTAQIGANHLLQERREWTLQRLLSTPTPRLVILLGKLTGTFVVCVMQLVLLLFFLTLVGSLMSGELQMIWGTNFLSIALVILAAALAACGLGALITALARTPEQSNIIGSAIILGMALVGGSFFNIQSVPALAPLSRLSITYWGTEAFTRLAQNRVDIGLNLLVLAGLGAVMFTLGVVIFNRRLNA